MKGLLDLKAWTSKDSLENREHVEKLQRVNNLFQTRRQEEKVCSSHHRFHFKALFNVPMFSVTRSSVHTESLNVSQSVDSCSATVIGLLVTAFWTC